MKNKLKALVCAAVIVCALFSFIAPAFAEEGEKPTVYIRSADDLARLSKDCRLDTYSQGLTVSLERDISLSGSDFEPIASFSGTFLGNGHTVSELELGGSITNAGLFCIVEKDGTVSDLNVSGRVDMSDSCIAVGGIVGENRGAVRRCSFSGAVSGKRCVGGIAGINLVTASISGCRSGGTVEGISMTGGIAGMNEGTVSSCENNAYVNTEGDDTALSTDALSILMSLDISRLGTGTVSGYVTDTGGIAGFSSGIIGSCLNNAVVGYKRVGYNCGGIAGRSCGHIFSCDNFGTVLGRKDIGGIAGQMEPYILHILSDSSLSLIGQELEELKYSVDRAKYDLEGGSDTINRELDSLSGYVNEAIYALRELGGGSGTRSDLDSLFGSVRDIRGQLSVINGSVADSSSLLYGDLRDVGDRFQSLSGAMLDAAKELEDPRSIISDTSTVDIDLVTMGKALKCRNFAAVEGDISVGGIVGSMAMEYSLDPEDDAAPAAGLKSRNEYELKVIAQSCTNTGSVLSKRSYAGGICGRMDMGLITRCCGYGSVTSESGDYVGGIAGITAAAVRGCYSKCSLSGGEYVGGIVGSGVAEALGGAVSTVTSCVSMVDISRCERCAGAISGGPEGEYKENRFVSDTLYGIDGLSMAGRAESVSFSLLMEDDEVPREMKSLSVSFVADGVTLRTLPISYGASVMPSQFPPLPEKEGQYGHWDREKLEKLHGDTVVKAVYEDYVTSIPSQLCREDGRPVFFVQGSFESGDRLSVISRSPGDEAFAPLSHGIGEAVKGYLQGCLREKRYVPYLCRSVAGEWEIAIPDDGSGSHTMRFLPDGGDTCLFLLKDGQWIPLASQPFGSYLEFELAGSTGVVAAVEVIPAIWLWLVFAAVPLLMAGIVFLMISGRRSGKKRAASKAENAGTEDAEKMNKPERPTGRRRIVLLVSALAVIIVAVIAAILYNSSLGRALAPYSMLKELSALRELGMDVNAHVTLDGDGSRYCAVLERQSTDNGTVTAVTAEGITVYYSDGAVILENGRAYRLARPVKEPSSLLPMLSQARISAETAGNETLYTLSLSGTDAGAILDTLLWDGGDIQISPEGLCVSMTASGGDITEIDMTASGTYGDGRKFSLSLTLSGFRQDISPIPHKVMDTLRFGMGGELPVLSDELIPLARAWARLLSQDCVSGDVKLRAAGGPLAVNDTLTLYSWPVAEGRIYALTKGGVTLYGNEKGVVNSQGRLLGSGEKDKGSLSRLNGLPGLLEYAYGLCLDGDITAAESMGRHIYTVSLDGDSISALMELIAPDIDVAAVTLSNGAMTLTLENDSIDAFSVSCTGKVDLLITESSCTLSATVKLMEGRTLPLPEEVKIALQ